MPDKSHLSFIHRKQTLCVDVKHAAKGRVTQKEWVAFLRNDLKIKPSEIEQVQYHSIADLLMVKVKDLQCFNNYLELLLAGVKWPAKGNVKVFGWSSDEVLTTVKFINIPYFVDIQFILNHMKKFGTILDHRVGVLSQTGCPDWDGIPDGSLTLKMKVNEGAVLPPFLDLTKHGESLQLVSDQVEKKCFRCFGKGHISLHCYQKPKNFTEENSVKTWAGIVSNNDGLGQSGETPPEGLLFHSPPPLEGPEHVRVNSESSIPLVEGSNEMPPPQSSVKAKNASEKIKKPLTMESESRALPFQQSDVLEDVVANSMQCNDLIGSTSTNERSRSVSMSRHRNKDAMDSSEGRLPQTITSNDPRVYKRKNSLSAESPKQAKAKAKAQAQ